MDGPGGGMVPIPFTPIIIIGAGRSGTNLLRDMLTTFDEFETWQCDEINPIWRHGNLLWPNDEIPVDKLTLSITNFVREQFIRLWKSRGKPDYIVEKTCANSLRVPFVSAILPEARFIHLVRNGYDVAASAEKRWKGDFEFPKTQYFLSKARYTPFCDLPVYAYRFLAARMKVAFGQAKRLSVWGPHFEGMADLRGVSLIDICALQWMNCIEQADQGFELLKDREVSVIKYEELTGNPFEVTSDLLHRVVPELTTSSCTIEHAISNIRTSSTSKGELVASRLSPTVHEKLRTVMRSKGYKVVC